MWYVLKNGKIIPCDFLEAGKFLNDERARKVDYTDLSNEPNYSGGKFVSTVFLCLDHNHCGSGPPILFETMIFGGKYDQSGWRYATLGEAKRGHWEIVDCLREGREPQLTSVPDEEIPEDLGGEGDDE